MYAVSGKEAVRPQRQPWRSFPMIFVTEGATRFREHPPQDESLLMVLEALMGYVVLPGFALAAV